MVLTEQEVLDVGVLQVDLAVCEHEIALYLIESHPFEEVLHHNHLAVVEEPVDIQRSQDLFNILVAFKILKFSLVFTR